MSAAADPAAPLALACEQFTDQLGGWLGQPANAVTSLGFVAAAAAVLAARRGHPAPGRRWAYAALVAAVGVGSAVQHGPHPDWQAYAHDLPLAAVLGFVAADAAADLRGRAALRWAWLPVPAVMVPAVAAGPTVSTAAQAGLAGAAIGLAVWRARRRPALRRPTLTAALLLGAGALAGSLTDRTGLCQPDTVLQGHALWHLLAAAALWRLAGAVTPAPAAYHHPHAVRESERPHEFHPH